MKRFLVDGHCDTITRLMDERKELIKNDLHIDIEKLNSFENPVQIFAIWLKKEYYANALEQTLKYIDFYNNQIEKYKEHIQRVIRIEDIEDNKKNGKISSILALEGGESLEGDINNLECIYDLGVRAMTLTWNYTNAIASGIGEKCDLGFTEFGYKVIEQMNKLGMIVDVSHLSEKGFWQFNKAYQGAFMASHSNVRSICNHARNLSDEQIKAIANKNGIIGINLYNEFLSTKKSVQIADVLEHIEYIIKLVGTDNIGFGCDFDGIDAMPEGMDNVSNLNDVIEKISKKHGDTVAEKIASANFIRFINDVWKNKMKD
jgi:membrane dipeptidase